MLVAEVREQLKKYKGNELRTIITEIYKSIPKGIREDKGIDTIITDINGYMNIGKIDKSKEIKMNINELKIEIETFLYNAYGQNYYAPNRDCAQKRKVELEIYSKKIPKSFGK
ncbi:MAG TPA: hypothetical protein DEG71_11495 [Clostridiales bacterium]|nr:hypothetical protein [Clostridiales bacterium]